MRRRVARAQVGGRHAAHRGRQRDGFGAWQVRSQAGACFPGRGPRDGPGKIVRGQSEGRHLGHRQAGLAARARREARFGVVHQAQSVDPEAAARRLNASRTTRSAARMASASGACPLPAARPAAKPAM